MGVRWGQGGREEHLEILQIHLTNVEHLGRRIATPPTLGRGLRPLLLGELGRRAVFLLEHRHLKNGRRMQKKLSTSLASVYWGGTCLFFQNGA